MNNLKPIPLNLDCFGWEEIPIKESKELLIPLGPYSDNDAILTRSIYAGEGTDSPYFKKPISRILTIFVRSEVAKQLKVAQDLLPKDLKLVVFDGQRSYQIQKYLFDQYIKKLRGSNPKLNKAELVIETNKYVAIPSKDPSCPSPHSTGGAVDLAIFDSKKKKMLEFATPYDYGGEMASLNYFEKLALKRKLTEKEQTARDNRRLLYQIMTGAKFYPTVSEWWHYNYQKTQMGAKMAGLKLAEYGLINLHPENLRFEEFRRKQKRQIKTFFPKALVISPLPIA